MAVATNVVRLAPARTVTPPRAPRHAASPRPGLVASLAAMWRAARTRRVLAGMDDRMLADIGISRAQAAFEADHLRWVAELR